MGMFSLIKWSRIADLQEWSRQLTDGDVGYLTRSAVFQWLHGGKLAETNRKSRNISVPNPAGLIFYKDIELR